MQQPALQLQEALRRIAATDGISVRQVSSFYLTEPWGERRQDDFVNAVAQVETGLAPLPLLQALQSIEQRMGRQRGGRRWGPRLIDIDLLLYGDRALDLPGLQLPHPHLHERAFVLVPLAELDANLEVPGRGAVGRLLRSLGQGGVRRLPGGARDPGTGCGAAGSGSGKGVA